MRDLPPARKDHILVVEDEEVISRFLHTLLESSGYGVTVAATAREALSLAASHTPDLILLDLGLPDMEGMQVLSGIRSWSALPVIVVSARQDEQEKVDLLDAGANDYVTKPFGNSELLARIRTALRLSGKRGDGDTAGGGSFVVGALRIDFARRLVWSGERPVHLTPIEYRIVAFLARNAGKVLTHDQIIREVWGPYASDSQILRVNMANIRRKLEPNPADPAYFLTEVGVGYRMADHE